MIQTLLNPYSASVLMATALSGVIAFTVAQVIATVPVSAINVVKPQTVHAVTKDDYFGVVGWVSRNSIEIIDSYGVSRVFTIDDSTNILKEAAATVPAKYSDIHIFDHVRITALKDALDIRAQTIEVN